MPITLKILVASLAISTSIEDPTGEVTNSGKATDSVTIAKVGHSHNHWPPTHQTSQEPTRISTANGSRCRGTLLSAYDTFNTGKIGDGKSAILNQLSSLRNNVYQNYILNTKAFF